LIPGPIRMEISEYYVKKNDKIIGTSSGTNSTVYFSKKYLEKHERIRKRDIEDLVKKYVNRELKQGLMQKNVI
jgi:hypothetical protein